MPVVRLLFYCSQAKPFLYMPYENDCFENDEVSQIYLSKDDPDIPFDTKLNGTIAAACYCDEVELFEMEYRNNDSVLQEINKLIVNDDDPEWWKRQNICSNEDPQSILNCKLLNDGCMSFDKLGKYACRHGYGKVHALHLSNLKILDKPKKLSDFYQIKSTHKNLFGELENEYEPIKCAPQNMMYAYDKYGHKYILISIRSIPFFNILTGKKIIEFRKWILKDLKNLLEVNSNVSH